MKFKLWLIYSILASLFCLSSAAHAAVTYENDLTVEEVGAWATGNSIFYIRVDRAIGPETCRDNVIKMYLGADDDSENDLMAKQTIKSLALTALVSGLKIRVGVSDTCLHNSPTIDTIYVKAK